MMCLSGGAFLLRAQEIAPNLLQEDFRIMRRALEEAHGGIYWYTSKAEMDRTFDAAYRKIDHPMTALEFWRLAAPVVAHIKCGHTYLWWPRELQTNLRTEIPLLPVAVRVFNDRLYIYRDYSNGSRKLEGTEILSVNGVSSRRILEAMMKIFTGDGDAATAKAYLIGHYGLFNNSLYTLMGIKSPYSVVCRDRNGKNLVTQMVGMPGRKISEVSMTRDPEPPTDVELKLLDGGKIAVLAIHHWFHYADESNKITFSDFLKTSFTKLRENGTSNLIIDVRDDSGGLDVPVVELFGYLYDKPFHDYRDITCNATNYDFLKYDPDAKSVPQDVAKGTTNGPDGKLHVIMQPGLGVQPTLQPHFGGRVFALMNGGSFSSSTEFLTLLHYYERAEFIGEEPGGSYYGYTCGRMVAPILPNSKLWLQFGILTFYMDVSGYKYRDRGVMPDYPVSHTLDDLLAGRDKDMEVALSLARAR